MRVTHSGMMSAYSAQIQKNMQRYNSVLTRSLNGGRTFTKGSDNVAAASRARTAYREYSLANLHLSNAESANEKYTQADTMMQDISDLLKTAYGYSTLAVTDTAQGERDIYAMQLRELQDQIVGYLNSTFSGQYVFAGADGDHQPFKLEDNKLYFYDSENDAWLDLDDSTQSNVDRIEEIMEKTAYVDIGWGLKVDDDGMGNYSVVSGTAFDTAINVLEYLGYGGKNSLTGGSLNIVNLMGQIADELESGTVERARDMWDQFEPQMNDFHVGMGKVSAKASTLQSTIKQIEASQFNRAERIDNLLYDELGVATELTQALYYYQASLQIGSSILGVSLLDYLN